MCLETVYSGRKKKTELAKLPDTITCWKIVRKQGNQHGRRYAPEYNHNLLTFLAGWNKTTRIFYYHYPMGFHAFRTKKGAMHWKSSYRADLHIVKCKTKKESIVAIGKQRNNLCLVTKRIWIPKPS